MALEPTPIRRLLHALNLQGRRSLWLLAALIVLLLPLAGGDALREALRYDRLQLARGEAWRFVTAHVVHLDAAHALLNAAGLVLLWVLFAGLGSTRYWLRAGLGSLLAMGAGFWWLQPGLAWYVGASGLLHGFMAAGTLGLWRHRDPIALPTTLVFLAKLAWEQAAGPLPFETHGTVIVAAHLYGALGGCAAVILPRAHSQDGR
jgi:rhomboid family GlyGly-CTERM serine protease